MNLETAKELFGLMVLINLGLFIWTAVMSTCCRRFICNVHSRLFKLEENTVNAMLYGFLAFYKIVFFVFVLVPWAALALMTK